MRLRSSFRDKGLEVSQQQGIHVRCVREIVGEYFADLVVSNRIVVELKSVRCLDNIHEAQCINYLKASQHPLCLLMNFSRPRLDLRRIITG